MQKMIINGKRVLSSNGEKIDIINPAPGELLDSVPAATKEDIDAAVQAGVEGQKIWGAYSVYERSLVLEKFIDALRSNTDEIGKLLSLETGKRLQEAKEEVQTAADVFVNFIEKMKHLYTEVYPIGNDAGNKNHIHFSLREPLGVVVSILPFNFPVSLFAHKVAPSLIAGNAALVKPPSDNPLAVIKLCEMLAEAGVPDGAIQVVTGRGSSIGNLLSSHPDIAAISLTGSTDVGLTTMQNAAKNLTPVALELGGNDGFIVLDDADLDAAADAAIAGRLGNAGQICCASKRFIISNKVKAEFIEKIVSRIKTMKIGNPIEPDTDMGCLINENAAKEVERQVNYTVEQGAVLVCGGNREGTYYYPTVLDNVTAEMDVAKDMEIFGPVMPMIGFDTDEEAIAISNGSKYGLSGNVFSKDIKRAMKMAAKLETGSVIINGFSAYRSMEMPFGGYKMSGIGNEGIAATLEEVTQIKNIVLFDVLAD